MTLDKLIQQMPSGALTPVGARGGTTRTIEAIAYDSRKAGPKTVFVAMRGAKTDGHQFLADAAKAGATLVGEDASALAGRGVPAFLTPNSRRAIAELSCALYGHPSREMDVVGVTGSNGITTTVHLIERLYAGLGFKTGRIGTLGVKMGEAEVEGAHTTPEAPDLQKTLREMADAGVRKVAVEVSSHALAQDRTWGTNFATVVFTNLTQDHLDYHADMEDYFHAKEQLFLQYRQNPVANDRGDNFNVLNLDDPYGKRLWDEALYSAIPYGLEDHGFGGSQLRASDIQPRPSGSTFRLAYCNMDREVRLRLPGLFNVYNALAALGAVFSYDEFGHADWNRVVDVLESLTGAPGRFEAVDEGQDFSVLVDYAHTPDALENVLKAAREITPAGRVLSVFGCGGDRDRTKRPKMGRIGVGSSDFAFITSDNPRTEDADAIIRDVLAGVENATNFAADPDRRAAIFAAVAAARAGDAVVIAGKGHEDYQIVGTEKHHFDDREVAREALAARRSQH
jgi:UDP-N-acetylmuramoyl-L-alanyl-D-glutamate--2,6-diaminopimelate ligase